MVNRAARREVAAIKVEALMASTKSATSIEHSNTCLEFVLTTQGARRSRQASMLSKKQGY
jgi:hypothetical protein